LSVIGRHRAGPVAPFRQSGHQQPCR
jgi:hypothetical protein